MTSRMPSISESVPSTIQEEPERIKSLKHRIEEYLYVNFALNQFFN